LSGVKKVNLKEKTALLEEKIKQMTNSSVKTFSRPGANKSSAFLHLARAVCRRLERRVAGLKKKSMNPLVAYLNFLSSFLFWLAKKEERIL